MIKPYKINLIIFAFLFLGILTVQAQTTRYVAFDAADGGSGASWADAYKDLQTAINASSAGDNVFVKKGQHVLTSPIVMKEGVKIYGSFAGTETSLSERVFGNTTADSTALDGNNAVKTVVENVFSSDAPLTNASVMDGFIITGGNGSSSGPEKDKLGAGVYCENASPILQNLIIRNNRSAVYAGAIAIWKASHPIIRNVIITDNVASRDGGAIWMDESETILENVIITGNKSSEDGGGICFRDMSHIKMTNVLISGNTAVNGGGLFIEANSRATNPIITNVTISGNFASGNKLGGGGVYADKDSHNPQFRNCIILGNNTGIKGPGISIADFSNSLVQGETGGENGNLDGSSITAAAVFVNPAEATNNAPTNAGDYGLKPVPGNPAVNGGGNVFYDAGQVPDLSHITIDLAGKPRKYGSNVDIGAYEMQNEPPVANDVLITRTTLQTGSTLTGSYTFADPNGDTESGSTFGWGRADDLDRTNYQVINESNAEEGKTYVVQPEDRGKYIWFYVLPSDGEKQGRNMSEPVKINTPPTAVNVMLTGTLRTGETLTGSYSFEDADGDTEGSSTLAWYRADDVSGAGAMLIAGAESSTYTMTSEDQGKYIAFQVTPNDGKENGEAKFSRWRKENTAPMASNVNIDGLLKEGEMLKGIYTYADTEGNAQSGSTYAWYRANDETGTGLMPIAGAESETYTVTAGDQGKYIAFEVTPSDGDLQGAPMKSAWLLVSEPNPGNTSPTASGVMISGTPEPRMKLTGEYTFADADGDTEGTSYYEWYRADNSAGDSQVKIEGAIQKEYQLVAADGGKYIRFKVTPRDQQGQYGAPVESDWIGPVLNKAIISFEMETIEKTYGDADFSAVAGSNSDADIVYSSGNEDVATINSASGEVHIVGAGTTTITASQAANDSWTAAEDSYELIVAQKTLAVTAMGAISKVYDGDNTANLAEVTYTLEEKVGDDDVSVNSAGATGVYADENAATGKVVTISGLSLQGANMDNYTLASTSVETSGDITKKELSVTVTGTITKTYDGSRDAALTEITYASSGVVDNDEVSVNSTGATGVYADENAATGKVVTISGLSLQGANMDNYTLASTSVETSGDITKKELSVTVTGTITKTYDGNKDAALTGITYASSGVVDNDEVSVNSTGATGVYADENAATGKVVTISGLSLEGADIDNYTLASTNVETSGDITKKELGVTVTGTITKTYDGNRDATLTGITYASSGVVDNDEVSVNSSAASAMYADKDAGTGKAVAISGLTLEGADMDNYTLAAVETTGDITPKALTIAVEDTTKKRGEEDPDFTVSYEGFVEGESQVNLDGSLSFSRAPGEGVGVYTVTASGYTSTNYDIAYVDGSLEIISTIAEVQALSAENFFTPNGDGINDTWVVKDVETFPSHSLLIVDRGGRKVYETKDYRNEWTGTVEGTFLQEGTYYYIFRFDDPKVAPKKGYITILRK